MGSNTFIIIYFLINTYLNYILTILASISFTALVGLVFYSFLASKSYYYYFLIALIISSIPILFVFYFSGLLIIPECIILLILITNGLEQGSNYYKMRVNKRANVFHHDPGVAHLSYGGQGFVPMTTAFRMDEVWNPDSSISLKSEDKELERKVFKIKMQVVSFLITIICFTFSLILAVYYY